MKRKECVDYCLFQKSKEPLKCKGSSSAPLNIALVKYWGKRDEELHLPLTSSLSLSLSMKTTTEVQLFSRSQRERDYFELNGKPVLETSSFYKRLSAFLDLFRFSHDVIFQVITHNEMPTAAGLASSASGFAALVLALDDLFEWQLPQNTLSILARLGSGSACRSLFPGFVLWEKGSRADGLDSHAMALAETWPSLAMAYVPVSHEEKPISSRVAMKRTMDTSPLYRLWPELVEKHIFEALQAIQQRAFTKLGEIAEQSALSMHATMMTSTPPVLLWQPHTVEVLQRVWQAREQGLQVYATLDAGPNVKLLFLEAQRSLLHHHFPEAINLDPLW
jgi:diphosphomevalonate decarboxylase